MDIRSAIVRFTVSDSNVPLIKRAVAFRFDPESVCEIEKEISTFGENVGTDVGLLLG
jgi:hypothetical protein